MKFAYFGYPHFGGTYGVFRHLRAGLSDAGIEMRWLGVGPGAHAALAAPCWADERRYGEVVGPAEPPEPDERRLGLALLRAVERGGFDGVFVNVLTSRAEMNVVRYLPAEITRVMIVHSITPGTYAAARALRDYVHATVGVSARVRRDLVHRHRFDPSRFFTVPNAVEMPAVGEGREAYDGPPRLLYLGRIEDASKGVFLLPRILDGLDASITLTVAGDGPDLLALRARCAGLGERVTFTGRVPQEQMDALFAAHDVFLMPSRFEGSPLALMEAMAAGCVPVATRLPGVTDAIVTDGRDGLLFGPGQIGAARQAVARLAADRPALRRMAQAAGALARDRFSRARMAEGYRDVIAFARAAPPPPSPPLDLVKWRLPAGMRPGLRTLLPAPAKTFLRTLRERVAV